MVTIRVHLHMPNLAGVAGPSGEQRTVNHDAASHTGIARDVDDVAVADRRASGALSQRAQVRFVGNKHAGMPGEVLRQERSERHVLPNEIGCQVHKTLTAPHDPRDCDRSPDKLSAGWYMAHQLTCKPADGGRRLGGGQLAARVTRLSETLVELAFWADPGDDESLGGKFDSQHPDPAGVEADDERRSPGSAAGRRWALAYETDGGQFADEARDSAAVEPCPGRQLRTRERPAQMQVADESSQVVTPQVFVHCRVGTRHMAVRLLCERAWQADPNTTGVCLGARRERT